MQWVAVDGVPRRVEAFADLKPASRPPMTCLSCGQSVVAKLGAKVAPHAAHLPNSVCALSSGESVLHFNVKMLLALHLRELSTLYVVRDCAGREHGECSGRAEPEEWCAPRWDHVEVEYTVGSRRPDIALLASGRAVGAVEVLVSHSVDDAKSLAFDEQKLSWIEVSALRWVMLQPRGDEEHPLPITRGVPGNDWWCSRHSPELVGDRPRRRR